MSRLPPSSDRDCEQLEDDELSMQYLLESGESSVTFGFSGASQTVSSIGDPALSDLSSYVLDVGFSCPAQELAPPTHLVPGPEPITNSESPSNWTPAVASNYNQLGDLSWQLDLREMNQNLISNPSPHHTTPLSSLASSNYLGYDGSILNQASAITHSPDTTTIPDWFQQPFDQNLHLCTAPEHDPDFPFQLTGTNPPRMYVFRTQAMSNNRADQTETHALNTPTFSYPSIDLTSTGFVPELSETEAISEKRDASGEDNPMFDAFHSSFDSLQGLQPLPVSNNIPQQESDCLHSSIGSRIVNRNGPMTREWSLPPRRKGGRRGKLNESKKKRLREIKVLGVCIRCRFLRIECDGRSSCSSCIMRSECPIWTKPCTKAQFLDIVEAGSYFPRAAMQEISLFRNMTDKLFAAQSGTMCFLHNTVGGSIFKTKPIPLLCRIPWGIAMGFLIAAFYDLNYGDDWSEDARFSTPSAFRLSSLLATITKEHPEGSVQFLFPRSEKSDEIDLQYSRLLFSLNTGLEHIERSAMDDDIPDLLRELGKLGGFEGDLLDATTGILFWLASRHSELCIFRSTQKDCNITRGRSTEAQKASIRNMLKLLVSNLGITTDALGQFELSEKDPSVQQAIRELADRQRRVRHALWVYISITISRLPSFTDAWEEWKDFMRIPYLSTNEVAKEFRTSLDAFDSTRRKKSKEGYQSFLRLQECTNNWNIMDMESQPITEGMKDFDFEGMEDVDFENMDSILEFARNLRLDDLTRRLDQRLTGGAFTAETDLQRKLVSTRVFLSLAGSQWTGIPFEPQLAILEEASHYMFLPHLLKAFDHRSLCIFMYEKYVDEGKPEIEALLRDALGSLGSISPENSEEQGQDPFTKVDFMAALRKGERWKSLADTFGPEIVLAHNPLQAMSEDEYSPSFNIPRVVESFNDEDYSQARDTLVAQCGWLKDTCHELQGLCDKITEWRRAIKARDDHGSVTLGKEIQTRVENTFGGIEFVANAVMPNGEHGPMAALWGEVTGQALGDDSNGFHLTIRKRPTTIAPSTLSK